MDVRNCKQCGKLFNYSGKSICPDCEKLREKDFIKVREYIRDNPSAGLSEVSEATETSVNQIRQWIREERLILSSESADAGINCEGCGRPITTGRLCKSCKSQMSRDLNESIKGTFVAAPESADMGRKKGDRMHYLSKDKK